ncbi:hypothetical protein ACFLYX_00100 [Chloroflexota bacterium]
MNISPFVIIGIVVGLILVGILAVIALRKHEEGKSKETDYRAFFILGISFLPLGIIYEIVFFVSGTKVFLVLGIAFIGMGISYLAIGLGNKDKWKKIDKSGSGGI